MKQFRAVAFIVVLSVVFGCSGCKSKTADQTASQTNSSGASAAPTSPRITDPCKLLTQEEASAAIGEKLGPPELKDMGVVMRCAFRIQSTGHELFLDVQKPTATVADPVLFDSLSHGPDSKPVSGMGEGATWSHSEYATFLYILKGGNMVAIGLPRTTATMTPEVEKAGKLVASRM